MCPVLKTQQRRFQVVCTLPGQRQTPTWEWVDVFDSWRNTYSSSCKKKVVSTAILLFARHSSNYCKHFVERKYTKASIMNHEGVCHEDLRTSYSQHKLSPAIRHPRSSSGGSIVWAPDPRLLGQALALQVCRVWHWMRICCKASCPECLLHGGLLQNLTHEGPLESHFLTVR